MFNGEHDDDRFRNAPAIARMSGLNECILYMNTARLFPFF